MALSYSVRPGGLTALSILNFVIAGGLFFSMISTSWVLSCMGSVLGNAGVNLNVMYVQIVFDLVTMVLLILSGVGYLRMEPGLGRIVANIYVLVGIGHLVFQIATGGGVSAATYTVDGQPQTSNGIDMTVILNKLYVVVTFVFVNLVFADVWAKSGMIAQAAKARKLHEASAGPNEIPGQDGAQTTTRGGRDSRAFGLILDYSLRQSLRGAAGVLTVFVGSSVVLWLAQIPYVVIDITHALQGQTGQIGNTNMFVTAVITALRPVLAAYLGITGPDDAWASSMMNGPSGIYDLSVIVMAAIVPVFTVMIAGTQIASDNRNGGLRFLLPRVARNDIYQGKVGAALIVVALLVILLNLLNYTYFVLHYRIGDPGDLFLFTMRGIFVHLMVAIPSAVLGVAVSGLIDSPGVSWITATGMVLWPILPSVISSQVPALKIGEFLMPHRAALYGFHPDVLPVIISIAACAAYSALFYIGGRKLFGRRDL